PGPRLRHQHQRRGNNPQQRRSRPRADHRAGRQFRPPARCREMDTVGIDAPGTAGALHRTGAAFAPVLAIMTMRKMPAASVPACVPARGTAFSGEPRLAAEATGHRPPSREPRWLHPSALNWPEETAMTTDPETSGA